MRIRAVICLNIAGLLTLYLAVVSPISRIDRAVVFLLVFVVYFVFLSAARLVIVGVRSVASKVGWSDFSVFQETRTGFWELAVPSGFLLTNYLATTFGYKDVVMPETWVPISSVPAQIGITATALTILFFLLRYVHEFASDWLKKRKALLVPALAVPFLWLFLPESEVEVISSVSASEQTFTGTSEKRPLVFIGLDGVDWRLLRAAIETGRLENFELMLDQGTTSSLDHSGYGLSPIIWTSMITGKDRHEHGIHDFLTYESRLFENRMDPWWFSIPPSLGLKSIFRGLEGVGLVRGRVATGEDRRGPSLWQILSRYGYRSLVVNYMVSFPAEQIDGVFLSQYVFHRALKLEAVKPTPISPAQQLPVTGFEHPEGILSTVGIEADISAIDERSPVGFAEAEFDYLSAVTLSLMASAQFDLIFFYAHYPDSFNHKLTVDDHDQILGGNFDQPGPATFLRAYQKMDVFIGRMRETMPDANILVVSDHGVSTGYKHNKRILQHFYAPNGVLTGMGPDLARAKVLESVSMFDVLPTVLCYFDLPVARDFRGEVASELLRGKCEPQFIDSYEPVVMNQRVAATSNDERESVERRLRALGYVQ